MQLELAHKVVYHGAPVTGTVGCFALDPANVLLYTKRAQSMECIKLTDIARPKNHHLDWLRENYSKSKPSSLYQL